MSVHSQNIKSVLRMEGRVAGEAELFLAASQESLPFHCPTCGAFMFYRQHRILALIQDDMSHLLLPAPLTLQCQKCGDSYRKRIF